MVLQCRPKALYRTFLNPDRGLRHAMRWYAQMGRRVWFHEVRGFLRDPLLRNGPTVRQFWGAPQDAEEQSMLPIRQRGVSPAAPAQIGPATIVQQA
jgi:anaerobic magnesium-protoporphyrin IX monomethyl ester cyclase